MSSVSIAGFHRYLDRRLHLASYFQHPGDGREQPQIEAGLLVWSLLAGFVLREWSFLGIEALVGSPARRALGVPRRFSDDTLDDFTERLSPEPTREAAHGVLRRVKRNKAFQSSVWIGFAVDGTATGGSAEPRCPLCRPQVNAQQEVVGYDHRLSLISVVGTGLSLPFDIEPWTSLRWPTVRVLRYRQTKKDGQIVEAYWLTDFPRRQVASRQLYHLAKSRWEVENQGFNDAKTRYGLRHVPHHHAGSLEVDWLLLVFAMTLERLWRLRYLHRGTHRPRTAIELLRRRRSTRAEPARALAPLRTGLAPPGDVSPQSL